MKKILFLFIIVSLYNVFASYSMPNNDTIEIVLSKNLDVSKRTDYWKIMSKIPSEQAQKYMALYCMSDTFEKVYLYSYELFPDNCFKNDITDFCNLENVKLLFLCYSRGNIYYTIDFNNDKSLTDEKKYKCKESMKACHKLIYKTIDNNNILHDDSTLITIEFNLNKDRLHYNFKETMTGCFEINFLPYSIKIDYQNYIDLSYDKTPISYSRSKDYIVPFIEIKSLTNDFKTKLSLEHDSLVVLYGDTYKFNQIAKDGRYVRLIKIKSDTKTP